MTRIEKDRLLELASAVCDQCATEDQVRELEAILRNEPEAQGVYSQYMMMHAELFWQQETLHTVGLGFESAEAGRGVRKSRIRQSLFSLAAMLLVGAGLGAVIVWSWSGLNSKPAQNGWVANNAKTNAASDEEWFGEAVATVTQTVNCRWTSDKTSSKTEPIGYGSELLAGQQLHLAQGVAEITFNTGVKIILESPAVLDLNSDFESILHKGRLTASVPKGAEGFQVACRGLTLVDRGTEFGVSADPKGDTEVQVFDGLVEGHVKDSAGSTFKKVSWKTNDKVLFSASTSEFRNVEQPTNFIRSLSQSASAAPGLLAAEEFDYPVGRLGGQNGGFGWGGPWEDISFVAEKPESNGVGGGSLAMPGIEHIGNHAMLSGQFNRIRRNLSTSFSGVFDTAGLVEAQDGARLIGHDGSQLYIGFVQQIGKLDDVFYGFELNRGDGNRNRVLCIGHGAARAWKVGPPRTPDKNAGVTKWSVTSEFNGPENGLLEIGWLGDETTEPVLVVVKLEFGAGNRDKVSVYVNPKSLEDESLCEPTSVGYGNFAFDRIGIANFEGDKSFEVDNVRLGLVFSSVASSRNASDTMSVSKKN